MSEIYSKKTDTSVPPPAPSVSQQLHDVAQAIFSTPGINPAEALNRVLAPYIGSFKSISAPIIDVDGNQTDTFASVLYLGIDVPQDSPVPADNVAVVIDVHERLNVQDFPSAFQRIRRMKSLKREKSIGSPEDVGIPFGVIFIMHSDMTLEGISEGLRRLNQDTPSEQWPDMVVLFTKGLISYAVQFPGDDSINTFFLSAKRNVPGSIPAMFILRTIRPAGAYTFNQMTSLIVGRLAVFAPKAGLMNFLALTEDIPNQALTDDGYQYNLNGDLLPVPREFYNDRLLLPAPLRIEDQDGGPLATVQFMPWQDGGIILLRGKFPLEMLYVFLKIAVPNIDISKAGIIPRPNVQISYVLPITRPDFNAMLTVFQQRSNMKIRSEANNFIMQKISDEGIGSPFMARIMMGIMKVRDLVYREEEKRNQFDQKYELVLSNLMSARTSMREIAQIWTEHSRKVDSGEIIQQSARGFHINESIDRELKREVESFLNAAVRALKNGMQTLTKELQSDIGFFFKKESTFNAGIAALQARDPVLADYLRQARSWSEVLIKIRNDDLEHGTWTLPRVNYTTNNMRVQAQEPMITGENVTVFISNMFDRLTCFVEDVTAHCLQGQMPHGITITEIPVLERNNEAPERFRATTAFAGLAPWALTYHLLSFEER